MDDTTTLGSYAGHREHVVFCTLIEGTNFF
jgi:hypothetical protein